MDLNKAIKFSETYARNYIFSFLSILWSPTLTTSTAGIGSAVLKASSGRIWSYVLVSILIGILFFNAANESYDIKNILRVVDILFTVWLWVLFSLLSFLLSKTLGGKANFVDTFSVCLRVLPTAYALSGLICFTISFFAFSGFEQHDRNFATSFVFLLSQFIIISIYLPLGLKNLHQLSALSLVFLAITLPAVVFSVNAFSLYYLAEEVGLQISPVMAPPPR